MKKGRFLIMLLAFLMSITAFAQNQQYTGTVVDSEGEPVMGASIMQKGAQNGAITNLDGQFTISVAPGTKLIVSYLGYESVEITVANNMRVVLKEDAQVLKDVVVIGYGVQKKSVVTASIAKVSADDLAGKAPVRVDNALKGLAAGVTVTSSSGAPGAGSQIRVRGIGTVNNSDPLYIVDGMPCESGIENINPNDIESIEVLKDAASGAIYGARAANGVILVTTKSGQMGKVKVNYNASFGWQSKWKSRDVLNATEYAVMMNEGLINSGQAPKYANPYDMGKGTDWQKAIFNDNAPVMNHEVSVSGASEKVNYYLSLGYYDQEGILGGNYGKSDYKRLTMRSNTKYNVFDDSKERAWLNKLDLSINLSYTRSKQHEINANTNSHGILNSALALAPTLPIVWTDPSDINNYLNEYGRLDHYAPQYDSNGNLYMVPGSDYDNQMNPVAFLATRGIAPETWVHNFTANFAADLSLGYGFKYRISYGADVTYRGVDRGFTLPFYLTASYNWGGKDGAYSWSNRGTVWQLENVLSWAKTFDKHDISVVLGQSAKKSTGFGISASKNYLVDYNHPWVDYATGSGEGELGAGAAPWEVATLASLFARASYNYDERYMVQATIRRDGSSRFGSNNHYATFPSFSLGWNVMNEKFMAKTSSWLNNFKVRFSYGKNGNENIGNFGYMLYTSATGGYNAIFGKDPIKNIGTRVNGLANPDLKWEESEQTDFGIDLGFFNNALTFSVDYYVKKTNGMLMADPVPDYVSIIKPTANVGEMKNSGVEFELGYKWNVSDAKFAVKANAAYLKNKLVRLGNATGTMEYESSQGLGTFTRAENGQPWPYFYGLKTNGIFQTEDEVKAYVDDNGNMIQPDAVPGDFRFVDVNKDGKIDDSDKTKIGKGMPDWTFGINFNAEWKGFDFMMFWQGTAGNDIYDATMRVDKTGQNLPSWMLNRWTGAGTSNSIPRFVFGNTTNLKSSDMYVNDASYLRLKNICLGYTLPSNITKKVFVNSFRVYLMAENLVTFTKYHGYDPEISSGGTSLGVDWGCYPQSRTWTIGFNIGF
ncbi:MAG: SusC/RagA family TonB-linked outer membrane protein [Prevotella sp.]